MEETDTKTFLTIALWAIGEPIAEQTRIALTIISPSAELDFKNVFLTQTSIGHYEELCRMDVLGLLDTLIGDQVVVYQEFLEQLKRISEGWYETAVAWKGDHASLTNNKMES